MENTKNSGFNAAEQAILQQTKNFEQAMASANAAAVAACYCEDAEFMAPGALPVAGRAAIQTALAGYLQQGFTQYNVSSTTVYGKDGIVGVQTTYTLSQTGGKNLDSGKSIQLWKQEHGTWKIFRDCFNSSLSASS